MLIGETEHFQDVLVEELFDNVVGVLEEPQVLLVALALVLHVPDFRQLVVKVPTRSQDLFHDHVRSCCRQILNF